MMLDPVEKASSSSINLNSCEHQRMISSENLERWMAIIDSAAVSSTIKSRSDTPSIELAQGASKPRSAAVMCLSMG